jgi:large subunit ribosomal protein L15
MKINELSPAKGAVKSRKRVGRGPGSGNGKTAGRGHKGQNSRSGRGTKAGFEGGQMPLQRRLPKRGFTNIFKKNYATINVKDLEKFQNNAHVDTNALREAGLISNVKDGVKLLGGGVVSTSLVVEVHRASRTACQKIEAAGGRVEIIG